MVNDKLKLFSRETLHLSAFSFFKQKTFLKTLLQPTCLMLKSAILPDFMAFLAIFSKNLAYTYLLFMKNMI